MICRRLRSGWWRPLLLVLSVGVGLLASGCMWGVVRDASSGAAVGGATVTFTDSSGQTASTTTDASGLYSFGPPPKPATGPVDLQVDASGYDTLTLQFQYDGSSNFWGVQSLTPASALVPYHNEEGDFSITLPAGWEIMDNFWGTGTVMAVPPAGSPDYPADISVGINPSPPATLEDWVDNTMGGVCNITADCEEVERGETTIDGMQALWAVVSYRMTTDSPLYTAGQQLEELAYFFKKGGEGYMIDLTATAANFTRLRGQYEQVAKSFKFD